MILPEIFGKNIWVIPSGKDTLTLIDLPDSKDTPIFGIIKNRDDFGLLMAYLVPNVQFSVTEQVMINMLYRVGKYKTRAEIFKIVPAGMQQINGFSLILYKAAAFSRESMKEEAEKLFRDQLICEMAEAWEQKQVINFEVRFERLFNFIQRSKEKKAHPPESKLIQ